MYLVGTHEGATLGERAGPRANIYENISHNTVTLKENNKAFNTTTPNEASLQLKGEGEMLLEPKGIYSRDVFSL